MKKFLLLLSAAIVLQARSAVVVETRHPTSDRVIAESVLSPRANADEDAAADLQRALDAVGAKGGGTLFLSAGVYTLAKSLTLPVGVTLRGDYAAETPARGTVLRIVGGRGDEQGTAAVSLNPGSGLLGLVFWYPEQKLLAPTPYPWTIRTALHPPTAADNQTVADCTIVNAWRGISIGPEWNELHTFRNVRVCALATGFAIDSTTDIGRVGEVTVSPSVWAGSGFPGSPDAATLASWLRGNGAVGADYGRSDWEFIWRLKVDGYATGVRFRRGLRGLTNAVMADSDVSGCTDALVLEALNGVGLAVYDSRLEGTDETVRFGEKFDSIVQFHSCHLGGRPVKAGRFATIVAGDGHPVRPTPMDPRVRVATNVYDVAAFGAATGADDNAAAFQRALDAAAKTGGTVYVPAGYYRFRNDLRVPAGVELRGCTDVPHHTCSGGSVLMPYPGRGDENGAPFVSLAAGAGLRGLGFWYPEQTTVGQVPYPWTIRAMGPGCWLRDVNVGNGWQGADFATHPSDGHRVSYFSGCCWRRALAVGKCGSRGWVEDLQFNPHYSLRRPKNFPVAKNPPPPAGRAPTGGWESWFLRAHLEGFVFRDCADEQIRGTFLYAARDGLAFYGRNKAALLIHGTDTGARDVVVDQEKGSLLRAALAQLVPYESTADVEKGGIVLPETDAGMSEFHASQFWVDKPTLIQRGRGRVNLEQFNSISGPVVVHSGFARIADGQFGIAHANHVVVSNGMACVERNAYRNGALKVCDPGRHAVVRGSSFSRTDAVKLPSAAPRDFFMNCEADCAVKPVEGRIAKQGGIRKVSGWSCTVVLDGDGHAIRLRGHTDDPSYSYLYCEIAVPNVPVYPDTVLEYRFKPMNAMSRSAAIDLGFDQGRPLRECGVGMHYGEVISKVGEWCTCRVALGKVAGRTVTSAMLKFDSRHCGGAFDVLVDDVRFTTPNPRENWNAKAVLKDGVVTFDPPYPHKVFYTTDGHSVDASSNTFTGSLKLPEGTKEFRWSPSMRDGSPSALEFGLAL